MKLIYDLDKDQINLDKHGCSLALAEQLDWGNLYYFLDQRHLYGEDRWVGFSHIKDRLYCVIFTKRTNAIRIISLRKANNREKKHVQKQKN